MALSFYPYNYNASLKLPKQLLHCYYYQQQQLQQVKVVCSTINNNNNNKSFERLKDVISKVGISSVSTPPLKSLHNGTWVKLICGASFEDVVDIRNLSLIYTLAGVDCIDCAADAAVVSAVNEGIQAAREIVPVRRPWVMISINDDEDPHFRKAEFDPEDCPLDCTRPCEMVCPANAISLTVHDADMQRKFKGGVMTERCYGCGRCIPVCPYDKIRTVTYVRDAIATSELVKRNDVDAVEIHTSGRQSHMFKELWNSLEDLTGLVSLIAVSLPDLGDSTVSLMNTMYSIMEPHLHCYNLWQLDGRPMSGDIGRGATRESINFASRLAAIKDRPRGFLQLAGGTNFHTIDGLKKERLFKMTSLPENCSSEISEARSVGSPPALIAGVAYGGYARKIVGKVLHKMQLQHGLSHVEEHPEYLSEALTEALGLVGSVKGYNLSNQL